MRVFCIIALSVSGALAGISLLAIPIWLMGVPGVDNAYAKGWRIGLYTVLIYPVTWALLFTFWRVVKKQMGQESVLHGWTGAGSLILLALAAGILFYAFKVMSRN